LAGSNQALPGSIEDGRTIELDLPAHELPDTIRVRREIGSLLDDHARDCVVAADGPGAPREFMDEVMAASGRLRRGG